MDGISLPGLWRSVSMVKRVRYHPTEGSPLFQFSGFVGDVIDETETRCRFVVKLPGYRRRAPSVAYISAVWDNVEVVSE